MAEAVKNSFTKGHEVNVEHQIEHKVKTLPTHQLDKEPRIYVIGFMHFGHDCPTEVLSPEQSIHSLRNPLQQV